MIERPHRSGARLIKFLMPARITGSLIGTRFASKSIRTIMPFSLLKGCLDIVAGLITKMAGETKPDQENVANSSSVTISRMMLANVIISVWPVSNLMALACKKKKINKYTRYVRFNLEFDEFRKMKKSNF
jgi:hypothetical protein